MRQKFSLLILQGLIAVAVSLFPCSAEGQESSYQAMSDHFFELLKDGKATAAVDYLTGTNPAMKKIPDTIENLRSQFGSIGALMGQYISNTKLVETRVAGMFVYQHYFVAYERQPISVRIKYYKPAKTWLCYGLQFDGEIADTIQKDADNRLSFPTEY